MKNGRDDDSGTDCLETRKAADPVPPVSEAVPEEIEFGSGRRSFMMKLSLFAVTAGLTQVRPAVAASSAASALSGNWVTIALTGTATINSSCGTATYSVNGTATYNSDSASITFNNLVVNGVRVSGHDYGAIHVNNVGNLTGPISPPNFYSATGNGAYTDARNSSLPIPVAISGNYSAGVVSTMQGNASAQGNCDALANIEVSVTINWS